MTKKYTVLQEGIKECGSACLLSIIKYYGGNISKERLLELTSTTKEGTTFYNLSLAAKEIGLTSKGYKIDNITSLSPDITPFISQIVINNYYHFVVVYKIKNNKITIMDPAKGMVSMSINEFNTLFTGNILLLEPYKKLPTYSENNYLLNVIVNTIKNNKKIIIKLILLTLIATIFTCIYSYHFKVIIDKIIYTNKLNLVIVLIIFIFILFIEEVSEFLRNNLLLYLNQKIDLSIITTTINKIVSLPYSYYKNKSTGEVISRINDLFYIKNVISKIIITIFLDSILAIFTLIILFIINKELTYIVLLLAFIYLLIFLAYKNSIKRYTDTIQESGAKVNSFLTETISSYETIKGLNLESNFTKKINYKYLNYINDNLSLSKLSISEEFLKNIVSSLLILFITYLGTTYIMDKSFTIGSILTYNTLLSYFINPLSQVFDFYQEFFYAKNSIKRINTILNYKYDELDKLSNLNVYGTIKINNLSFSYNQKHMVFKNLSLEIKKAEKVLILGPSGSGKSSLLKILFKYYPVSRDKVYLNNYDINDLTIKDIRTKFTYLSQNELLYTDTIRNNITLSRNISEEEFLKVCKITYVDDLVKDNLLSYNYPLEENGVNLSGGQRQRIILARALLKESSYILIDEGLNEIDINLERKILKSIFDNYQHKTIIIISHRLDNMDLYTKVINLSKRSILTYNEWHSRYRNNFKKE